jgi:hypothetical protein
MYIYNHIFWLHPPADKIRAAPVVTYYIKYEGTIVNDKWGAFWEEKVLAYLKARGRVSPEQRERKPTKEHIRIIYSSVVIGTCISEMQVYSIIATPACISGPVDNEIYTYKTQKSPIHMEFSMLLSFQQKLRYRNFFLLLTLTRTRK